MYNSDIDADNVCQLITELCKNSLAQHGVALPNDTAVRKLKAKSFEILLKKSRNSHYKTNDENFDVVKSIDAHIFHMTLNARNDPIRKRHCEKVEKVWDTLVDHPYFMTSTGRAILRFLYELLPEESVEELIEPSRPELLVPAAFTLFANYHGNIYFPENLTNNLLNRDPCYFPSIQDVSATDNPYLPKFFVKGEKSLLPKLDTSDVFATHNWDDDGKCTFTGLTRQLWSRITCINPCGFNLFTENVEKANKMLDYCKNKPLTTIPSVAPPSNEHKRRAVCWNWEHLGCYDIVHAKPFACEANIALHLETLCTQSPRTNFVVKIVSLKQFLNDLRLLTVGTQTNIFPYDGQAFSMQKNISVEGLLTSTVTSYVRCYLECGNCVRRLQQLTAKHNFKLKYNGFMFKALCGAVDEYLITFKQFVLAQEDANFMSFHQRLRKIIKLLLNLSHTLGVHPDAVSDATPPMGSHILGHLYREIMYLTEKDYIALLVFVLRRCCQVYFGYLQKWIFNGVLDDPHEELFIGYIDHYRRNTKFFYDRAYQVRKEVVPGFLTKHQQQILMCGKYTMLLKANKPNHPLFKLQTPSIPVCVSREELKTFEHRCDQYYQNARKVCGEPITIRSLFEKRAEQRSKFLQKTSQRAVENLERWTSEQREKALVAAAIKQKRFDELTAQIKEAEQQKFEKRRASVIHQLMMLKEAQRVAEENDRIVNVNLRKRIEYYQELNDMLTAEAQKHEQQANASPTATPGGRKQSPIRHSNKSPTAGSDIESFCGDDIITLCASSGDIADESDGEEFCSLLKTVKGNKLDAVSSESNVNGPTAPMNANTESKLAEPIRPLHTIRRSVSDFINSNMPVSQVISQMELNRQRVMSSTNMSDCMRSARKVVFNDTIQDSQLDNAIKSPICLTEAQRNKMRVLTEEYGAYRNDSLRRSLPDINLNTIPDGDLSDLQRNRQRMMHTDTFRECNKEIPLARANLNLDLETDLERNRRKVLASEFDITFGNRVEKKGNTLSSSAEVLTPMSTTSDTPLTESVSGCVMNDKRHDLANGNISSTTIALSHPGSNLVLPVIDGIAEQQDELLNSARTLTEETTTTSVKGLKLNVELANVVNQQPGMATVSGSMPQSSALDTASSQAQLTPDSALNTAALLARQPFDFPDAQAKRHTQQVTLLTAAQEREDEVPYEMEDLMQEDSYLLTPYDLEYERCRQMLDTHFECSPITPYFALKKSAPVEPEATSKQLNLNELCVITLTECLKQSVVMPLSKHLQIVNGEVMRMYLEDLRLMEHIRSLRHYFFLMDGEFASHICDGVISKLENGALPDTLLNYQTLHAIVENALGSSIRGNEKNASNLSFIVSSVPVFFDLNSPNVLDVLSLSYRITWPLSLILNPETMEQYGNIFRYLIKVRRISWILERTFEILKDIAKKHNTAMQLSPQYRHVQQIRHKFYHFVNTLQNHITAKALQASWKTFKDELLHATCIEDIYRRHTIYIKRILFLCMLNRSSADFYNTIENIFKILLRFSNHLNAREFRLRPGDDFYTHPRYPKMVQDEVEFDRCMEFTIYLGNKIVRHGYQAEIGEFINLINFNNYYKEKPIKKSA